MIRPSILQFSYDNGSSVSRVFLDVYIFFVLLHLNMSYSLRNDCYSFKSRTFS